MELVDPLGASVLLIFDCANSLRAYLDEMYIGHIFHLSPVQIHAVQPDSQITESVEIHAVQPNNHFTESCMAATSNVYTTMSNCTLTNNTLTDSIRYKDASLVRRNNHTYHANEGSMPKGKMYRKKVKGRKMILIIW